MPTCDASHGGADSRHSTIKAAIPRCLAWGSRLTGEGEGCFGTEALAWGVGRRRTGRWDTCISLGNGRFGASYPVGDFWESESLIKVRAEVGYLAEKTLRKVKAF